MVHSSVGIIKINQLMEEELGTQELELQNQIETYKAQVKFLPYWWVITSILLWTKVSSCGEQF